MMDDAQYEALVEAARSEQTPKEQVEFLTQIREYFPADKQETALAAFEFVCKVAYLRGQRDLLIETVEKQKASREQPA